MLSRVADSIYWLCRYMERAENLARFVDVNLHLNLDLPDDLNGQWEPLVRTTGESPLFQKRHEHFDQQSVIDFLVCDSSYPNSILSCVHAARENARSVREIISTEMWEQINAFYHTLSEACEAGAAEDNPHKLLREVREESHLFFGIMHATMSHNEGWHFGRLAQHLERADKTSRILDMKYYILLPEVQDVGTPFDNLQWASLLKSASAYEMYRKQYGRIDYQRVAEFLILDPYFPRAIRYSLVQAELSLHRISGSPLDRFANQGEKLMGKLRSELDYTQIEDIIGGGMHEFIDSLQTRLNTVGQAIYDEYIALRPTGASPLSKQEQLQ